MNRPILFLFLTCLPVVSTAADSRPLAPVRTIEDFSTQEPGKFPGQFRTLPFQRHKASQVYRVKQEGSNRYLAAEDRNDLSVQIFRKFYWETADTPILKWRWRARIHPAGADESNPATNDSACGIYVVFGGYTGKSVKYIWSARQPLGKEISKKRGRSFSVVTSSGPAGIWKEVSTDVREDYHRLFGEEPKQDPIGVGFLTDGNATHTPAACDYDDFRVIAR